MRSNPHPRNVRPNAGVRVAEDSVEVEILRVAAHGRTRDWEGDAPAEPSDSLGGSFALPTYYGHDGAVVLLESLCRLDQMRPNSDNCSKIPETHGEFVAMSMIFPGMDPYLENPSLWPGVHNSLIVHIRDRLQPNLRPRYVASIEERVYLEGADRQVMPDVFVKAVDFSASRRGGSAGAAVADEPVVVHVPEVEIHESFIEIIDLATDRRVVTVIEVVSPTNKFAGAGRRLYLRKQEEVRQSTAHLVEIDLLRTGPHVLAVPEYVARNRGHYDYLISVNRADGELRDNFELYLKRLPDPLPKIRIPLAGDDADVRLDLQAVLAHTYESASYRDLLNYRRPCLPPLADDIQAWADGIIAEALPAQ